MSKVVKDKLGKDGKAVVVLKKDELGLGRFRSGSVLKRHAG